MTTMELLFIILFVVGLFMVFAAAFRKQSGFLKGINPVWAGVIGVLLVIPGFFYGIMPMMPEEAVDTDTPGTIIIDNTDNSLSYPEFDITPAAVTTAGTYCVDTTLNSAKTVFTVPAWANTTADTVIHRDNATAWADPRLQFDIIPVPYAGADADDLATIYFTVSNYDVVIDVADAANEYLMVKSSGDWQVIWTEGSNTWYVEGSKTMLMTGNATVYLDLDTNPAGFANIDENDSVDLTVTFHNADWSWSKSYTVSFMVQYAYT